ncbi:MAG: hypothetical protein ACREPB_09390 [Arenimonas sp.]
MNIMLKPTLMAIFFSFFAVHGSALADDVKSTAKAATESYEIQMDALVAKHEAFQIAIKDDESFRKNWLTRLQLAAISKPKTAKTPNFVLSLGSEMMLDNIDPYLSRADDDTAIAFMGVLTKIFALSVENESICKTFLDSADDLAVSDTDNERIESELGPVFYEEMIAVIGRVMRSGKTGPKNVLAKNESERVITEMLGVMMEDYGVESVMKMQSLDDKSIPPIEKCTTMTQMLSSITKLKGTDQAGLIRTIFGAEKD